MIDLLYLHPGEAKVHQERKCIWCQDAFTPKRVDKVYCSRKCVDAAGRKRRGVPVLGMVKVPCGNCAEMFLKTHAAQRYCSLECSTYHKSTRSVQRQKDWRKENRNLSREHSMRWRRQNRYKRRAHRMVEHALRVGRLVKSICEVCNAVNVQAHHDDYSKPLTVKWLCALHHKRRHKELEARETRI